MHSGHEAYSEPKHKIVLFQKELPEKLVFQGRVNSTAIFFDHDS
jgi:hypothetical protein